MLMLGFDGIEIAVSVCRVPLNSGGADGSRLEKLVLIAGASIPKAASSTGRTGSLIDGTPKDGAAGIAPISKSESIAFISGFSGADGWLGRSIWRSCGCADMFSGVHAGKLVGGMLARLGTDAI